MLDAPQGRAENPFEQSVCEGAGAFSTELDVPSLNAAAAEQVLAQTQLVREDHHSRCMLMLGQPGIGKSHVLARVRDRTYADAFPVVVRSYSRPGAVFRTLFRQVAWALLRGHSRVKGDLLRELVNEGIRAVYQHEVHGPNLRARVEEDRSRNLSAGLLQRRFIEFCVDAFEDCAVAALGSREALPLYSLDAVRVIFLYYLVDRRMKTRVKHWLTGRDLSEEDLEALGLQRSLDDEEAAREALATLGLFGAMTRPLLLSLDQTEQLESSPEETGIEAMGRLVAYLREVPGFSVVFTCLRDRWRVDYSRELPSSFVDRITGGGNSVVELAYPTPDEGLELIQRRLGGALEPFVKENLTTFLDRHRPSPRILLQECARYFGRWLRDGREGSVELPLDAYENQGDETLEGSLERRWAETLNATAAPDSLDPQGIEAALALLLTETGLTRSGQPVTQLAPPKRSRVPLVVRAGKQRVGFVLDATENGTRFANLLKALQRELDGGSFDRLVVWRQDPPKSSWKVGRALWEELGLRREVALQQPSAETLRRLTAFRRLCSDLQADGRDHREAAAILPEVVGASEELGELLQAVGVRAGARAEATPPPEPTSPTAAPAVRDLISHLVRERKVLERETLRALTAATAEASVEDAVFERALDDLETAGMLWRLDASPGSYVVCAR